ncbi:SDR family oxidoreductase [Ferrimonas sp. YFM]|uniref:SDR family oxidoreductase n=1 Tax=Ferrimonas sp. YFM TaxID=3028878 RepID=UPI0025748D5B|nr:SDR family oxidoreductase [Ferrimonas sp. YFM]BDY04912.1 citronellol catabolism dehydrogenase [Ferrimonas sp. YFM]
MHYQSIYRPGLFQEQVILVTGGGSGIGRCIAHELASLGAQVVLIGRSTHKLEKVCGEIRDDGGQASLYTLDIRDEPGVVQAIASLLEQHGQIDALVNNAGGQFPSPLEQISLKGFSAVVYTNLVGGFLMARECYRQWMKQNGGSVVNITADFHNGMPGMGHSGAARAGMENFSKTAAWEWGHSGVRVNSVAPGWVASSGMDTYEEPMRSLIPKLQAQVPLKRMATEAEVSAAVTFLLSPGAAFINGATIKVDGGASLGSATWPIGREQAHNNQGFDGFHRAQAPKVLQGGRDGED